MKLFFISATITRDSTQEKVVISQSIEPHDESNVCSILSWETAASLAAAVGAAFPFSPVLLTEGQVEVVQAFKEGIKPWNKVHGAIQETWFMTLNRKNVSNIKIEEIDLFK